MRLNIFSVKIYCQPLNPLFPLYYSRNCYRYAPDWSRCRVSVVYREIRSVRNRFLDIVQVVVCISRFIMKSCWSVSEKRFRRWLPGDWGLFHTWWGYYHSETVIVKKGFFAGASGGGIRKVNLVPTRWGQVIDMPRSIRKSVSRMNTERLSRKWRGSSDLLRIRIACPGEMSAWHC